MSCLKSITVYPEVLPDHCLHGSGQVNGFELIRPVVHRHKRRYSSTLGSSGDPMHSQRVARQAEHLNISAETAQKRYTGGQQK